jgi:F-type H+-transporting ATPase subunit b
MQIDWFTLIAQIINFLILVVLLKRFLYKPIIRAMDEREANIASRMKEAEEKIAGAQQEVESYRQKQQELQQQRDAMLAQAGEEASAHRQELINQARADVDEVKAKWYEALEREKDAFLKDLRQRAIAQVYNVVRDALAALANEDLEEQIIDVFIERIQKLDEDQRKMMLAALKNSPKVFIRSTFAIAEERRQKIKKVVQAQFANNVDVSFETSADLICGLEMKSGGYKVAWHLEDYLANLEESLSKVLEVDKSRFIGEEVENSEAENENEGKVEEESTGARAS